jgi:tRNA-2-methylthio-N6-dimethylallyladenosine synthase
MDTVSLVEAVRYDSAFTFIFSPRAGTEAAGMDDPVPSTEKTARLQHLIEVVRRIAGERNQRFVGTVQEVLVEGAARKGDGLLRGRTRHNVTVNFAGHAVPGSLVDVNIAEASSETLGGTEVQAPIPV